MADTDRVSVDDLEFAADWLRTYEGGPGDENTERAVRVAAWLEAEFTRRKRAAVERQVIREVAARTGRSSTDPAVRDAARRVLSTVLPTNGGRDAVR